MSREKAYARMLDASAKMQWNLAMILEAKAVEAEKARNWLINHITPEAYTEHQEHLKETLLVHDLLIEVIDGITKLNQGMASVLTTVLEQGQAGGNDMGNMFSSFDMGDKTE